MATAGGETVALDLTITPELRLAGLARDAVRLIQEARKGSGLEVSDRISLLWRSDRPEIREALAVHRAAIADEVLAVEFAEFTASDTASALFGDADLGLEFTVRKQ